MLINTRPTWVDIEDIDDYESRQQAFALVDDLECEAEQALAAADDGNNDIRGARLGAVHDLRRLVHAAFGDAWVGCHAARRADDERTGCKHCDDIAAKIARGEAISHPVRGH